MSKKSQHRPSTAPHSSPTADKKNRDRKDDKAGNVVDEPPPRPILHPPRKNMPMLILSIVLLIAWLIIMLAIAVMN